jgi:GNAT superfamily N-acetyltransferase
MNIQFYRNLHSFRDATFPFLLESEAEYNLIVGHIASVIDRFGEHLPDDDTSIFCTIECDGTVVGAAVQRAPYNLIVTRMPTDAPALLAASLRDREYTLPGVIGPTEYAKSFVTEWKRHTPTVIADTKRLFGHRLDRLEETPVPRGHAVFATQQDFDCAVRWTREFLTELHLPDYPVEKDVTERIKKTQFMFWKNPGPVAMVACTGQTPNGIRVSNVYTPPEHRRNSYATALVAALSKHLLESGLEFCFLFTDADDPVANAVYPKIGYRVISEYLEYRFEKD